MESKSVGSFIQQLERESLLGGIGKRHFLTRRIGESHMKTKTEKGETTFFRFKTTFTSEEELLTAFTGKKVGNVSKVGTKAQTER